MLTTFSLALGARSSLVIVSPGSAALNAYAARHFGPRRINLMHAAYAIGAVTSPLIVTAVVSAGNSWRWALSINAWFCRGRLLFRERWRSWNHEPFSKRGPQPYLGLGATS